MISFVVDIWQHFFWPLRLISPNCITVSFCLFRGPSFNYHKTGGTCGILKVTPRQNPMALTIASLNVRGLRDNAKRREVFNWLKQWKQFSIYMLQEVYASKNQMIYGLQNRATKQFLAPTVVTKQEYAYFSTTILTCKFKGSLLIS